MDFTDQITLDPAILAGKPIIKGTRLSVEFIIDLLGQGWTEIDLLRNYPGLTREQILACLQYAARLFTLEKSYPLTVESCEWSRRGLGH